MRYVARFRAQAQVLAGPVCCILMAGFITSAWSQQPRPAVVPPPGGAPGSPQSAPRLPRRVSFATSVEIDSYMVGRGVAFTRGPVLQPSITVTAAPFNLFVRGNTDLSGEPAHPRFNELDIVPSAEANLRRLRLQVAVPIFVLIDSRAPDSAELSASLSYPAGPFRLITTHSFDIAAHRGSYFGEAGVARTLEVGQKLAFDGSLKVGFANEKFNRTYVGHSESGLHYFGVEVALTCSFHGFQLRPSVALSVRTQNRSIALLGRPDNIVVSVSLAHAF